MVAANLSLASNENRQHNKDNVFFFLQWFIVSKCEIFTYEVIKYDTLGHMLQL